MIMYTTPTNLLLCPYSVLGIRRDATKSEIRRSYRRLALLHHPHRHHNNNNNEAEEKWKFLVINAAYETLIDDLVRRRYDSQKRISLTSSSSSIGNNNIITSLILQRHQPTNSSKNNNYNTYNNISSIDYSKNIVENRSGGCCSSFKVNFPMVTNAIVGGHSFGTSVDYDDSIHSTSLISDGDESSINHDYDIDNENNHGYNEDALSLSKVLDSDYLFGGPLHYMHKARNHAVFTDPYLLFSSVFQSDLFQASSTSRNKKQQQPQCNTRSPNCLDKEQREDVCNFHHASTITSSNNNISTGTNIWNGTSSTIHKNGIRISKTCRIVQGRKIIRTEKTLIDPITKLKSTTVEVHWDDSNYNNNDEEEEMMIDVDMNYKNISSSKDSVIINDVSNDINFCGINTDLWSCYTKQDIYCGALSFC